MDALIRIAGGPNQVRTVIDVGANDGADSLPYARLHPSIRFIAIEPTPELAEKLRAQSEVLGNYTVVQCAVGKAEGEAILNIRRSSVHNSLGPIDESSVADTPVPLETFAVADKVSVPVRTLESLCDELQIERIDVLHVDAQGSDMDVLISAGALLDTLCVGVVEVSRGWRLYSNSVARGDFIRYLVRNGFQVVRIEANDPQNYEQNVFFTRSQNPYLGRARTFGAIVRIDVPHGYRRARARAAIRTRLRGAMKTVGDRRVPPRL